MASCESCLHFDVCYYRIIHSSYKDFTAICDCIYYKSTANVAEVKHGQRKEEK